MTLLNVIMTTNAITMRSTFFLTRYLLVIKAVQR